MKHFLYATLDINGFSADIRNTMNQKFFKIAGGNKFILRLFILCGLFPIASFSQSESNLDIFFSLIDSAAIKTAEEVRTTTTEAGLTTELGVYYTVFENRIFSKLNSEGLKLKRGSELKSDEPLLKFIISEALVEYGEQKRDGFLGDFVVSRKLRLSGSYSLTSTSDFSITKVNEFSINHTDKVRVEDIEKLENRSYPFTLGALPKEPFFSSLLEPVVAVGAAAIAVILFFSVRSK